MEFHSVPLPFQDVFQFSRRHSWSTSAIASCPCKISTFQQIDSTEDSHLPHSTIRDTVSKDRMRELHAVCTVELLHSIAFISCFVVHTCFSMSSFDGSVSFHSQSFSLSCSHLKGEAAFVSSTQHSVRQDHMVGAFRTGVTWPGHNAAFVSSTDSPVMQRPTFRSTHAKDARIQPPPNRPPDATNYSSMRINWPELSVKTHHLTAKNPLLFLLDSVL